MAFNICVVVHVMSMAAAAWLVGAPIISIGLFFGPHIKRIKLGDAVLNIHAIPLGGYVKFSKDFQEGHPLNQILIAISGCIALLVLASVVFGVSEAFHKFVSGFTQIISGALSPRSEGSQFLIALYEFAKNNPFTLCLGLFASKFAAANMLPFPSLNGGDIILMLLNWIKPVSEKLRDKFKSFGIVILLIIMICWIVAFYFFIRRILI